MLLGELELVELLCAERFVKSKLSIDYFDLFNVLLNLLTF